MPFRVDPVFSGSQDYPTKKYSKDYLRFAQQKTLTTRRGFQTIYESGLEALIFTADGDMR